MLMAPYRPPPPLRSAFVPSSSNRGAGASANRATRAPARGREGQAIPIDDGIERLGVTDHRNPKPPVLAAVAVETQPASLVKLPRPQVGLQDGDDDPSIPVGLERAQGPLEKMGSNPLGEQGGMHVQVAHLTDPPGQLPAFPMSVRETEPDHRPVHGCDPQASTESLPAGVPFALRARQGMKAPAPQPGQARNRQRAQVPVRKQAIVARLPARGVHTGDAPCIANARMSDPGLHICSVARTVGSTRGLPPRPTSPPTT